MHTPFELIASLRERGVTIWLEGQQIRLRSPKGILLPSELEELRARRDEIIDHLGTCVSLASIPMWPRRVGVTPPLTATQRMPWYSAESRRLRPRSTTFAIRIHGPLQVSTLRRGLEVLQHRHEALRTRIVPGDGVPTMRIEACADYRPTIVDAAQGTLSNAEDAARRCAQEFIDRKLDYSSDPMFGTCLIRLASDDHMLVMSIEHLISDGVSVEILKRELWNVYRALTEGRAVELRPVRLQFADYAAWLESAQPLWLSAHGTYWRTRLADIPEPRWPAAPLTSGGRKAPFVTRDASLDAQVSADLLRFAQRNRILPSLVLCTAFVAAASRWCSQPDLTTALVDGGRFRSELIPMVGLLTTHLHLRVKCSEQAPLADLLELVKMEFDNACKHRDFDWVTSLVPGLSVDLAFNWAPAASTGAEELADQGGDCARLRTQLIPLRIEEQEVAAVLSLLPFKLMLFCSQSRDGVTGHLSFDADYFWCSAPDRFVAMFRAVLSTLLEQPTQQLQSVTARSS